MGSIIASLATLLALIMAGAFAAPILVDWNQFKPQIEQYASQALGKPVRLSGDIGLTVLPELRFEARDIHILEEDASEAALLKAESVSVLMSLSALVTGRIEAAEVFLDKPEVRIATDSDGRLNWAGVTFKPELPGFMGDPDVSIRAVRVLRGEVSDARGEGGGFSVSNLSASVQADDPRGPYRLSATFAAGEENFEASAVANAEPAGGLRFRAAVQSSGGELNTQFDGLLHLVQGAPRLAGEIRSTATLAFARSEGDQLNEVQVTGRLTANPRSIELANAEVTLAPNTSPQVLTGGIRVNLDQPEVAIDVRGTALNWAALASPNEADATKPSRKALRLDRALKWLDGKAEMPIRTSLDIRQLSAGDEIVEEFRGTVARLNGRWLAERLSARLPGDTQLTLAGTIAGGGDPKFSGIVDLSGANFSRFLKWLYPGSAGIDTRLAQAFMLKGAVVLDNTLASVEGASGEIGGSPFTGSLRYDFAGNGKLALSLSSDRLNLTGLDGVPFMDGTTGASWWSGTDAATEGATAARLSAMDEVDLNLDVKRIDFRSFQVLRLLTRLRLQAGLIDIGRLDFETSDALNVAGSGRLLVNNGRPEGQIRGTLEAQSGAAVSRVLGFLGGSQLSSLNGSQLEALTPARFDAQLSADRVAGSGGVTLNGTIGGSRVLLRGSMKSGATAEAPTYSLDADVTALDGEAMVAQVLTLVGVSAPPAKGLAPGRLNLRLGGPAAKLEGQIELATEKLTGTANGTVDWAAPALGFDGNVSLRVNEPARYVGNVGIASGFGLAGPTLNVQAKVLRSAGVWTLSDLIAKGEGNTVTGNVRFDATSATPSVSASLVTGFASLPAMLEPLLADEQTAVVANAGLISKESIWPERPFRASAFAALNGSIELAADRLEIAAPLAMTKARLKIELEPSRISATRIQGRLLGGEVRASGALVWKDGRVQLNSKTSLARLDLASLGRAEQKPLVDARASASLEFSGEGLSPRGLISVLAGRGRLSVVPGRVNRLLPSAIEKVAVGALDNPNPPNQAAFEARLADEIRSGGFRFRALKTTIGLERGTMSVSNAIFRSRGQSVRLTADLDLSSLVVDSEWRLVAKAGRAAPWPPVVVGFAGPLGELALLEPRLLADDLYRTVALRKMERDVERLERLSGPPLRGWSAAPEPAGTGSTAPASSRLQLRPPDYQSAQPFPSNVQEVEPGRTRAFQEQIRSILQQSQTARGSRDPRTLEDVTLERKAVPPIELPAKRPNRP